MSKIDSGPTPKPTPRPKPYPNPNPPREVHHVPPDENPYDPRCDADKIEKKTDEAEDAPCTCEKAEKYCELLQSAAVIVGAPASLQMCKDA
ncbi:MAG: hypothetical protein KDA57_23150, partial [Planctomycetales bacterium]|nr:hypothetical protein [Planctomycetales bacterium]